MSSTKITTNNGTEVILQHRFLSPEFCEKVEAYYYKKHNLPSSLRLSTYFMADAVEEYIKENNVQPEYE